MPIISLLLNFAFRSPLGGQLKSKLVRRQLRTRPAPYGPYDTAGQVALMPHRLRSYLLPTRTLISEDTHSRARIAPGLRWEHSSPQKASSLTRNADDPLVG